jgi:cell division protein FtsB
LSEKKKNLLKIFAIVVCILGLVVAWLGFGQRGLVRLYQTEMERQAYMEKIRHLTEENQALQDEIARLRTDEQYIEAMARKQFNMVRENEVIYRFSQENNGDDLNAPPVKNPAAKVESGREELKNNGATR